MQMFIRSQDADKTKNLHSSIETNIDDALARFEKRVSRATVYLSDQNGPRGGIDKRCRIVVKLHRQGEITVEDSSNRWLGAVAGAVDRLRRTISRQLDKWRSRRKRFDAKAWKRANSDTRENEITSRLQQ